MGPYRTGAARRGYRRRPDRAGFTIPAARHILGIVRILIATAIAVTSYTRWERRERAIRLGGPLPPPLLPRLVGGGLAIVMLLALVFVLVEAVQGGR